MLKSVTLILAAEFINIGNEFVSVDGLSIPIEAVIEMAIAPLDSE